MGLKTYCHPPQKKILIIFSARCQLYHILHHFNYWEAKHNSEAACGTTRTAEPNTNRTLKQPECWLGITSKSKLTKGQEDCTNANPHLFIELLSQEYAMYRYVQKNNSVQPSKTVWGASEQSQAHTLHCHALCILLHCFATKEWLKILAFTIQQNLLLRKVPVSKSHHYLQTTADEMEFFRFLTTNEPMNNWIAISFGHVEPALATACGRLLAPNEGSKSDFSLMWTWPPSIKDGTVQFRLLHFLFHHSRRTVSNPLVKIALPDVV